MQFKQYQYDSNNKMQPNTLTRFPSTTMKQETQTLPQSVGPASFEPTPVDTNTMKVVNNVSDSSPVMGSDDDKQLAMFCLSPLVQHNGDQGDLSERTRTSYDDNISKSDYQGSSMILGDGQGYSTNPEDDAIPLLSSSMIQFAKDFQPYTPTSSANSCYSNNNGTQQQQQQQQQQPQPYQQQPQPYQQQPQYQPQQPQYQQPQEYQQPQQYQLLQQYQQQYPQLQNHHLRSGSFGSSWGGSSDAGSYVFDISATTSHGKSSDDWVRRFQELCLYKQKYGSCAVPHDWKENRALANWVKRQRYQYSLKKAGKHSTLTDARQQALEQIGFRWKLHKAMWNERFNELKAFKAKNGHCNVPSRYPPNPTLAIWVQSQRRQYKLFMKKKTSHMTMERIERLRSIGFEWSGRDANSRKS